MTLSAPGAVWRSSQFVATILFGCLSPAKASIVDISNFHATYSTQGGVIGAHQINDNAPTTFSFANKTIRGQSYMDWQSGDFHSEVTLDRVGNEPPYGGSISAGGVANFFLKVQGADGLYSVPIGGHWTFTPGDITTSIGASMYIVALDGSGTPYTKICDSLNPSACTTTINGQVVEEGLPQRVILSSTTVYAVQFGTGTTANPTFLDCCTYQGGTLLSEFHPYFPVFDSNLLGAKSFSDPSLGSEYYLSFSPEFRNIVPANIPEPSSLALISVCLLWLSRKRISRHAILPSRSKKYKSRK